MDLPAVAWLSGLVTGTACLTYTYRTEFAFNIPYHLACITLAITGLVLVVASYVSSTFTTPPSPPSASYIPLPNVEEKKHDRYSSKSAPSDPYTPIESRQFFPSRRRVWSTFALFVFVTCTRLEMARWVVTHSECARWSAASAIPFLLTLYLATRRTSDFPQTPALDDEDVSASCGRLSVAQWRNLIPASMISLGAFLTTNSLPGLRSTYICAATTPYPTMIPQLQVAGTILDVVIILMIDRLVSRGRILKGIAPVNRLADPGWAALAAYTIFALAGVLFFRFLPINRYWYTKMPFRYVASAAKVATIFALTSLSALQTNRRLGLLCTTAIAVFVAANMASLRTASSLPSTFLPSQSLAVIAALGLLSTGFVILLHVEAAQNSQWRLRSRFMRVPRRLIVVLAISYGLQVCFWSFQPGRQMHKHPIETLMKDADDQYNGWLKQTSSSKTVAEAAKEYRRRYKRDPPPRFNAWYDYAKLHGSLIIDDFDSMVEGLAPFWSLSPGDIRLRTFESVSNPWNYIGGIQVRKGKLAITQNVPPTHKWMMEAIVEMIEHFVKWLPDMDLAFNLNDEPRSAVRFKEMQGRYAIGHNPNQLPTSENGDFQPDRFWIPVPGEPLEESRYKEGSFHDSFYRYGSVGCPSWAKARRHRHWDLRESCAECVAEHSLGQFVKDWNHAADPCHQPDLADNFGLHSSPNSFKGTNELMPVFSQSKAHGYNDILYPSPWTYIDKDAYEPTKDEPDYAFRDKVSTLYWRGTTTEGMAIGNGAWKGMARQRLVHMFNNASDADRPLILLPTSPSDPKNVDVPQAYNYQTLPPSTLHTHLSTSIGIVDGIDRCAGPDCPIQTAEFRPSPSSSPSFQSHWRYKYLLDLDGAGASGHFLPFLQSNSLPFKASLLREWWEPRIIAWKHFVPVDIRFTETWSLLAYFAGWRKDVKRDVWLMRPHEREAEKIASEGREWAGRVLRKEDMEIYFFRLLLEWGRLTDDRRDELGWMGDRD